MSNIDKQALRESANASNEASWGKWESYKPHKGARGYEVKVGIKAVAQHCLKVDSDFIAAANPATVLALLDELEAETSYREGAFIACNHWHDKFRESEAKLEAAYKRTAEQADIIAKQEKWIKDVEVTMIAATDRAEAKDKQIADLKEAFRIVLTAAGITLQEGA